MSIRVMIADDHALLRAGIASVLSSNEGIELVAQAGNGQEAIEQFQRVRPDVTLMDLHMPLLGGYQAMLAIRALNQRAKVIVLTGDCGDAQIQRALNAGAAGYLLKGEGRMELAEAIESVHAGRKYIPPQVAMEVGAWLGTNALSAREIEVLRLVAQGNSNREIGAELGIREETVKAHVSAALVKLDARDRTHAVTIATRRGILAECAL